MKVYTDTEGTSGSLQRVLGEAAKAEPEGCLLVLSCDANGFTPELLDPILKNVPVPIFGGTFPAVISEGRKMTHGSVVVAMGWKAQVYSLSGMSDPEIDFEEMLDAQVGEEEFKTLMVFVDGLSTRINAFIEALYMIFGLEINYVGAGAGSASLQKKPCLITNDGLKGDGVVLAALDMESGVGVRHGWESVSRPYKVTESSRNTIMSLDWQPAFEVYKSVVEPHSGKSFTELPFFDLATSYPFGIAKLGSERVIRDPVSVDQDLNIICVGEVPVGEYVDILHGEPENLITATGEALQRAWADFPDSATPGLSLFIDCLSRALFLKEKYSEELQAATSEDVVSVGICSIGEVANSGKDYIEFYNKTSVVAFLEDK